MNARSSGPASPRASTPYRPARRALPRAGASALVGIVLVATALVAAGAGAAPLARRTAAAAAPTRPRRIPPVMHPSLPGEGVWRPGSYRVEGSTPIWITTYRPDPAEPATVAYVAWIDHTRTRLALYPGFADPPTASPRGDAEVPHDQRWRLLATFNGGFKWKAGPAGFVVNGHADEPLIRGLGTVVAHASGHVDIVDWQGPPTLRSLVLARQNLTLLVNDGRAAANAGAVTAWGATLGGSAAVWRSALGIDRHGNLIYAAANSITPATLAALMIHVGAMRALELDINPEWMSFNGYAKRGGRDPIPLVPNPQESAYRWLVPDSRDFFAVYTRAGGGAAVPFR